MPEETVLIQPVCVERDNDGWWVNSTCQISMVFTRMTTASVTASTGTRWHLLMSSS